MQLDSPFVRLPLRFDADRLAAEVAELPASAWRPHAQGEPGNSAVALVAREGDPDDDAARGPMRATPYLARMPFARQLLGALDTVVGRTRLMRVRAGAALQLHADTNRYWREHLRIHLPAVTNPDVLFRVGHISVHMAPGEAWVFDTWASHGVSNAGDEDRVHLVVDTVGSPSLWSLIDAGSPVPADGEARRLPSEEQLVTFDPAAAAEIRFESVNQPTVMGPWEQRAHIADILDELDEADADAETTGRFAAVLRVFHRAWRATWSEHGSSAVQDYVRLRDDLDVALVPLEWQVTLTNGVDAAEAVRQLLVRSAVDPDVAARVDDGTRTRASTSRRHIVRPVFIVAPPRSGTSLLFEALARSPDAWTIGGESHQVIEVIPQLNPANRGWDSNRLDATDADSQVEGRLDAAFFARARDRTGRSPADSSPVRLVEKTPKNAIRVPFLAASYPDASFVYLYRDPRETLSSMLDAWRSGRFITYPDLPDWPGPPWSLLLVPGWRELRGKALQEVVAHQWATTTRQLLDDLSELDPGRWCVASYARLVSEPQEEVRRLCEFLELAWDDELRAPLPPAAHTLTAPDPSKWRRNEDQLRDAWPIVKDTANRAHEVFADPPVTRPVRRAGSADAARVRPAHRSDRHRVGPRPDRAAPFASVYTPSLPQLLGSLGSSLAVSTYQSGRLILVRSRGEEINTHFRFFPSPMGIAARGRRLAIGTRHALWDFRDQPALAAKVEPAGTHDACYVPRSSHVTGDIRIHEIVYLGNELWAANTRFSCLSTFEPDSSFAPRWRPPFVTALAAEDRCHLNGIGLRDGAIRYVTALGMTDEPHGWRPSKADGGVILGFPGGEVIAHGLSMPHSPRWHDGRLWVLESGHGALCTVDEATGGVERVAALPGFTRGLAFAGPFAFVGLSQVRETLFGGIPLTDRLQPHERSCGVYVIDIRKGTTVGFLRFEGAVQEIFDVQVLQGVRWPELVEPGADLVDGAFVVPDATLGDFSVGRPDGRPGAAPAPA